MTFVVITALGVGTVFVVAAYRDTTLKNTLQWVMGQAPPPQGATDTIAGKPVAGGTITNTVAVNTPQIENTF